MANNEKRPEKSITLESGEVLTMTYVVFNDILRYVGSVEDALSSLMTNQDVRDLVVRRLLTDNKKPVEDLKDLIALENVEIDIFELDDILSWTMEHVTYFFMKTASKLQASVTKYPELTEKLMKMSSDLSGTGSTA